MASSTIQEIITLVQKEIKGTKYLGSPAELYEPMNYILQLGGKRLRPVTTLLAANLFIEDVSVALPAAKAIEVFHNFTLVHDDIMDKAPLRRGQPTVHQKWDDNIAILSGDTLLIEAYNHFLEGNYANLSALLTVFNQTAIEVCEGQQLDMNFESRDDVTIDEYINMIKLKTSVLVGGALKLGALVGSASDTEADLIYNFGVNLGIAFQLQDDYLDCFGDPEKFGKQVGGDIISNKKTFLMLKALELDSSELLQGWVDKKDFDAIAKVEAVKTIYKDLKVDQLAFNQMDAYYQKSIQFLNRINAPEDKKKVLEEFANHLMKRAS
ncbi:MAG: polyprenyl synthetase family protein [Flavobacteriales bacterium]|nr:polyprenyl synthetase family protein [Flavobacteriales bacterium]